MQSTMVLVIHVRSEQVREAFIRQQLESLGMPFEFILDGDVPDLTPAILDRYFADDCTPSTMYGPFPRTSCAYKHLLAAQYILDHDLPGALVIEDDLFLYPNFTTLFSKSLGEIASRYASQPVLANYEESSLLLVPRKCRKNGQVLYPATRDRYAGCLYLNRACAQTIADYVQRHKIDRPIDRFHALLIQQSLIVSLWSWPCLACQRTADGSMPTLIPTKPRPLKRLKWHFKRLYKHILYFFR